MNQHPGQYNNPHGHPPPPAGAPGGAPPPPLYPPPPSHLAPPSDVAPPPPPFPPHHNMPPYPPPMGPPRGGMAAAGLPPNNNNMMPPNMMPLPPQHPNIAHGSSNNSPYNTATRLSPPDVSALAAAASADGGGSLERAIAQAHSAVQAQFQRDETSVVGPNGNVLAPTVSIPPKKSVSKKSDKPTKYKRRTKKYNNFNIFFMLERQLLLQSRGGGIDAIKNPIDTSDSPMVEHKELHLPSLPRRYSHLPLTSNYFLEIQHQQHKKRAHRKSHGLIPFKELAQTIAKNYREIDDETQSFVNEVAERLGWHCEEIEAIEQKKFKERQEEERRNDPNYDDEEEDEEGRTVLGKSIFASNRKRSKEAPVVSAKGASKGTLSNEEVASVVHLMGMKSNSKSNSPINTTVQGVGASKAAASTTANHLLGMKSNSPNVVQGGASKAAASTTANHLLGMKSNSPSISQGGMGASKAAVATTSVSTNVGSHAASVPQGSGAPSQHPGQAADGYTQAHPQDQDGSKAPSQHPGGSGPHLQDPESDLLQLELARAMNQRLESERRIQQLHKEMDITRAQSSGASASEMMPASVLSSLPPNVVASLLGSGSDVGAAPRHAEQLRAEIEREIIKEALAQGILPNHGERPAKRAKKDEGGKDGGAAGETEPKAGTGPAPSASDPMALRDMDREKIARELLARDPQLAPQIGGGQPQDPMDMYQDLMARGGGTDAERDQLEKILMDRISSQRAAVSAASRIGDGGGLSQYPHMPPPHPSSHMPPGYHPRDTGGYPPYMSQMYPPRHRPPVGLSASHPPPVSSPPKTNPDLLLEMAHAASCKGNFGLSYDDIKNAWEDMKKKEGGGAAAGLGAASGGGEASGALNN